MNRLHYTILGDPTDMAALQNTIKVLGTKQATTSGTSIDFTSIPSWAKVIRVMFDVVSTNGTSNLLIQIGDSGGVENTGYSSGAVLVNVPTSASSTAGFILTGSNASANTTSGLVTLSLLDSATFAWVISGNVGSTSNLNVCSGSKALSATLDRVRITTVNGTDAFDAGSVNIMYS